MNYQPHPNPESCLFLIQPLSLPVRSLKISLLDIQTHIKTVIINEHDRMCTVIINEHDRMCYCYKFCKHLHLYKSKICFKKKLIWGPMKK